MLPNREHVVVCPNCGGSDFVTEPAVDDEGMATGVVLVTCESCGCGIGELAPLEPGPEAEPAERVSTVVRNEET